MVQSKCFFLTPTRHLFAVKFVKWKRYLVVLWLFGYIFFNVKRVEFLEIGEIFWAKRYCKIRYLFCQLFLALRISVKKSEIKKHSDDAHWNIWKNCHLSRFLKNDKASSENCMPEIIFWKSSKYEILNHLYFGPNFVFWGLL